MHVGRALAKLNPKNVRFDVGSGGIPDLTPQDIAAALGFVDDGIGRELLCQVWWPDGARLTEKNLFAILADIQRLEWQRREDQMVDAMLVVAMHGGAKGQAAYSTAHADRWPTMVQLRLGLPIVAKAYEGIRRAVVAEMKSAGLCPSCNGRAAVRIESGQICICPQCLGSGHMAISERARADASRIDWKSYRENWYRVYEWTATICTNSLQRAMSQFIARIGA